MATQTFGLVDRAPPVVGANGIFAGVRKLPERLAVHFVFQARARINTVGTATDAHDRAALVWHDLAQSLVVLNLLRPVAMIVKQ